LSQRISIACSMILVAAGCSSQPPNNPETARPIKTMIVAGGEEPHVRFFPGMLEASKKVELAFQVSGLLVQFPVKEGQRVAKGEVIGQLRQDEFQARLKSLQGQLDQARAALRALQAGERPEQQLALEAQVRAADARSWQNLTGHRGCNSRSISKRSHNGPIRQPKPFKSEWP